MTTTPTVPAYPGLYDDGDGQGPRDVLVRPAPTRLEIRDRRGLPVALWPYAEIALDSGRDGEALSRAIHLTRVGQAGTTLSVFDPALATDLRPRLKAARAAAAGRRPKRRAPAPALADWRRLIAAPRLRRTLRASAWALGLMSAGVGLYAAVAATAPVVAARMAPSVPPEWSVTWGATLAAAAGSRCEAPAGREALESLVGRLEASAGPGAPALEVTVVDDPAVEARALPGGHILLTRGMIDALRTPDELAGVLAHAIADTGTHGPMRTLLGHLRPGELVTVWQDGAQSPPALLSAALTRARPVPADLAETDAAAIALLRDAGLRTRGLAGVHDVLNSRADRDGRPALYLRSHPADPARMDRLRDVPPGGAMALSWDRWLAVKALCGAPAPMLRGITG
ncbi:M48 family metalloprotease [Caenispirillum salinarum]|uniref:M48 family metalloprotease n=1 Tax=Caenispirillum salinarum TaxID=859058 RepID=UPI00384F92D8